MPDSNKAEDHDAAITGRPSPRPAHYVLVALAFAAAYGQAPLYYSNQNQYFLHGFAWAKQGLLEKDWLAQTLDPTPIFSLLVEFTMVALPPWTFHVYHALLMGIYAAAMLDLFVTLSSGSSPAALSGRAAVAWPVFAVLFILCHAAALRWCSYRCVALDYPWYLQAGVASQYILGAMLQPSAFGMLLVAALALFLRDWLTASSLCIAAAGIIHGTYLLPGAMLTCGFLARLAWERRFRDGLLVGILTLVLVLPMAIYSSSTFRPSSPADFARAQEILVHVRIPHHCVVNRWLDLGAWLQIAWMILGIALVWRTRLFIVLVVCFVLGTLLTVMQVLTSSDLLALLFPWRISTILVPVSTMIVMGRLADLITATRFSGLAAVWGSFTGMALLAIAGIGICVGGLAFQSPEEDVGVMEFVRQHKKPGDVYLLPVTIPDLNKNKGAWLRMLSGDFKPPPDKKRDDRLIPADLQQFRLSTGAPIYVDFKSIPYKDDEVIAWFDRLVFAAAVRKQLQEGNLQAVVEELHRRRITHLVQAARREAPLVHPGLRLVYPPPDSKDRNYRVYEVRPVPARE